jgi:hypothetical protein
MNVHASGNQHAQQAWMNARPKHVEAQTAADEGVARTKEVTDPVEATADDGSKGVIRLLQAGHFNGVADVRLRINFHDQLQQGTAQNAARTFEDAVPGLLDDLAEKTSLLGEQYGLSSQGKELVDSFAQEIQALLEEAKTAETPLTTTLADMESRFSTFLESLGGAFAGLPSFIVEESNPDEEEIAELLEDGEALNQDEQPPQQAAAALNEDEMDEAGGGLAQPDGQAAFKAALQELQTWFSQSLASLQSDAIAAHELPPLSEPRGNGAAYSKFLEIYRNLNSGVEAGGTSVTSDATMLDSEV